MFERLLKPTEEPGANRHAAFAGAIERLRGGGAPHPRACTPLGDLKAPERQRAFDAVRAGPPSVVQQARELYERHRREDADIRAALRRARAARRPAWRPPVAHACPSSTPRPRMIVASGRDGSGGRDDGSGSDDGGGGNGDGDGPSPPHPKSASGPRAEVIPQSELRACVPTYGRARS